MPETFSPKAQEKDILSIIIMSPPREGERKRYRLDETTASNSKPKLTFKRLLRTRRTGL